MNVREGSLEICRQSLKNKIWVISKRTILEAPPPLPPPHSYQFCIWGSHMYHMDIIGHVAAALSPLARPRGSARPPSLS